MIHEIDRLLGGFRNCFSRRAAFSWFAVLVFGLIVRFDHYGVTSVVRWLGLAPSCYLALLNFFRAASFRLAAVQKQWCRTVLANSPLVRIGGHCVPIGDGIKVAKESRKMPGVKKLHQESNNSNKPQFIFGHHHGVVGVLAGTAGKLFCIPLLAGLHEGMKQIRTPEAEPQPTLVTQMVAMAARLAREINGRCLVVLDGFFAVGSAFLAAAQVADSSGERLLHPITKAKSNVVACEPPSGTKRRGRPAKYGRRLKLSDLFVSRLGQFQECSLTVYGETKKLLYLCLDLFWPPVKGKVRFVLAIDGNERFILMSSHLGLHPVDIITAYGHRFKIEVTFGVMKNHLGAFFYHFWTTVWPKLERGQTEADLSGVDAGARRLIAQTASAIEVFVNCGCIATGILQILALRCSRAIWKDYPGWLRTRTSVIPSEETVRTAIQENFIHNFYVFRNTAIFKIIMSRSRKGYHERHERVA